MAEAILYNCLILLLGVSSIRFNKVVENIHMILGLKMSTHIGE